MPELPEVETIARGLRETLPGREVISVRVIRPDLVSTPLHRFRRGLKGSRFRAVGRRGKNLLLHLEQPEGVALRVNLGMSGRVLHREPGTRWPEPSHPGVRFRLDDDGELVYHDVRRFGRLQLMTPEDLLAWTTSLGPEPLDRSFTRSRLVNDLARSTSPIRSWLLDQRRLAGVGNIYANEALFRAGVHPASRAADLDEAEADRLHRSIRAVLKEAIRSRGTTLRDYRTAQGWEGSFASRLRVYGREGEPCGQCHTPVARLVFGGRSAFFCPTCQPVNAR